MNPEEREQIRQRAYEKVRTEVDPTDRRLLLSWHGQYRQDVPRLLNHIEAVERERDGANELHDAAVALFDAVRHNPASDYTEVKAEALDRLRTVLLRIEEQG